jgi:streptomycin 6-kinase
VPAVPACFARTVATVFGPEGECWLAALPALLDDIVAQWDLTFGATFDLSMNWVAHMRRADGSPAVLKLGVPQPGHLAREATTLRLFDGRGAVRLLAEDRERGALLLQRARPGIPIRTLVPDRDEEATAAIIDLIRLLHRPAPPGVALTELECYGRAFGDPRGLPPDLVERAGKVFAELCASATDRVVLHGDLHHDNVLSVGVSSGHGDPWLAIDPHGVVGDPGYEVGALLYNPDPPRRDDALLALVPARVEQLADGLGMPVDRVVAWGFVQGVLSELWTREGGQARDTRALDVARLLQPRLP